MLAHAVGSATHQTPEAPVHAPTIQTVHRDEWCSLVRGFSDHNYRQSWDYAEAMAARAGAVAEHVLVASGDQPLGLASVRVKSMPGTGIAYVSGGPLLRTLDEAGRSSRLDTVLAALVGRYVRERHLVLRVAPTVGEPAWTRDQERAFLSAGFRPAPGVAGYDTIVVDLAPPVEEVRAALASKWRYHLRKAEGADLVLRWGTDASLFDEFRPLFDEFVTRKSFAVELGAEFYGSLQRTLPDHERLYLAIASLDGEPAAGIVLSILGDTAVYLLGASNDAGRRTCAPYLLQWRAINEARARGLRWYDLGGIDRTGNPGVYRFKARTGGIETSAAGPYEIAPGPVRAAAVRTAERVIRTARARRR